MRHSYFQQLVYRLTVYRKVDFPIWTFSKSDIGYIANNGEWGLIKSHYDGKKTGITCIDNYYYRNWHVLESKLRKNSSISECSSSTISYDN
jgi:hypothetical protein